MRKDRNTSGGGVMIGFKGDLVVSHRPDLDVDDAEILWAQLEIAGSKPLFIGIFYIDLKSPNCQSMTIS